MPPKRKVKKNSKYFEDNVSEEENSQSDFSEMFLKFGSDIGKLQETVANLSLKLENKNEPKSDVQPHMQSHTDNANNFNFYILNWRELGGSNLSFHPNGKVHPMVFLRKLKKTFIDAGVPPEKQTSLAINCLKGSAADWASLREHTFKNFNDFENAFGDRFWGVDKQRELYLELNYGKFESGKRADYFLHMVNQASFLSTPIPENNLIEKLSKHFSPEIERGIITLGFKTIDEIQNYLYRLDEADARQSDFSYTSLAARRDQRVNVNGQVRRGGAGGGVDRSGDFSRNNGRWRDNSDRRPNNSREEGRQDRTDDNICMLSNFIQKSEDLLTDSDGEISSEEDNDFKSPIIQGDICNEKVEILLDSGSEVSAISQDFYERIKSKQNIPILPVTNRSIMIAIGAKPYRIKNQVLLTIILDKIKFDVPCLIIPKLNRDILFGSDWMKVFSAELDFKNKMLKFTVDKENYNVKFVKPQDYTEVESLVINKIELTRNNSTIEDKGKIKQRHVYDSTDLELVVNKSNLEKDRDKSKLLAILTEYKDVFSESPGLVNNYVHHINMKDTECFNPQLYPIPLCYKAEVRKYIHEMTEMGIIKPEYTEYVSPLVIVKKKDKTIRVCLDARFLNSKMNKDFVNPPNPHEILFHFKQGQVLSTIDLTSSYWQIPIKKEDQKYVGFIFEGLSYTFNRVPFGLSTSMASLIRCLTKILGVTDYLLVYVDDLVIFSDSMDQHLQHLNIVLRKLKLAGMTIKLRKCQFFRNEVHYLGHIISSQGVMIDKIRVKSINEFPRPINIKALRAFLGLVNYDKRFCNNYSELTLPLLNLLKKNQTWKWNEVHEKAFQDIKMLYLKVTMVYHCDLNKEFYIECDSSNYAIGGCLYLLNDNDK